MIAGLVEALMEGAGGREIVTRMLMQQAAISERGCSEKPAGAAQDQR